MDVSLFSTNGGGLTHQWNFKSRFLDRQNKGNIKKRKRFVGNSSVGFGPRVIAMLLFVALVLVFLVMIGILRRMLL